MPRKPRIHVPGAFYHVTLQGNHRQDIFFCPEHRQWLETIIQETIGRFNARVHAYCWMTNHIHLVIQVGDVPLGRLMLRIASRYARQVQSHLSTRGHLFERRYHAILVDADAYLLELIRYIHLNPVRAKMVDTPDDYAWSSHHCYAGHRESPWVTIDFGLSMWYCEKARAHQTYARFVAEGIYHGTTKRPLDEVNISDDRVLGDDHFIAQSQLKAWRPRSTKTMEQVIAEACQFFSVTTEQLNSRQSSRIYAQARAWIAYQCSVGRIASVSAVAHRFDRDESTLRQGIVRYYSDHSN